MATILYYQDTRNMYTNISHTGTCIYCLYYTKLSPCQPRNDSPFCLKFGSVFSTKPSLKNNDILPDRYALFVGNNGSSTMYLQFYKTCSLNSFSWMQSRFILLKLFRKRFHLWLLIWSKGLWFQTVLFKLWCLKEDLNILSTPTSFFLNLRLDSAQVVEHCNSVWTSPIVATL